MSETLELLFEIGVEEVPAGYIEPALADMSNRLRAGLDELGLTHDEVLVFGTPRRLTLALRELQARQPDRRKEHIGPAKSAGLDAEGKPTKAAIGFARSKGLAPEALQVVDTPKGEYLMAIEDIKGEETKKLLPPLLERLVRETVFPKSMRWADTNLAFARPIRWFLALYGGETLPLSLENIPCGDVSYGHRFHAPESFPVRGLDQYLSELRERHVLPDPAERRALIEEGARRVTAEDVPTPGARVVVHEGLLATVTNLVEEPFPVCGRFDEKFLEVPAEALITSMRENQKYFPVVDASGKLLPHFVAVNNTHVADKKLAAAGHERVLRARLEDALFFFNEDRKEPLESRCAGLDGIVFHQKLGTMRAKMERVTTLAAFLAGKLSPELTDTVRRAARLAKADLLTSMVGEFPTLQGIMGRVYALHDGEPEAVAQAIEEHYMPIRAGEAAPASLAGAIVGLADRMDTLAGCFAAGERPTGNKDPLGLRRQALGLISVIRKHNLSLSLRELAQAALSGYGDLPGAAEAKNLDELLTFIRLRFENEQIASGRAQDVVEAATAAKFDDINDAVLRMEAIQALRQEADFRILAASFKRINNIVKDNRATDIRPELFAEPAESALFAALEEARQKSRPLLDAARYREALSVMLLIKDPVDRFFDTVMVMAEDPALRANRLNLLTALRGLMLEVADISKIGVEE